jgi:hypothetical protein
MADGPLAAIKTPTDTAADTDRDRLIRIADVDAVQIDQSGLISDVTA